MPIFVHERQLSSKDKDLIRDVFAPLQDISVEELIELAKGSAHPLNPYMDWDSSREDQRRQMFELIDVGNS
jgi:hypothetical protein